MSGHDGIRVKSQATWFLISWMVLSLQMDFLLRSTYHLYSDRTGQLEEDIYIVVSSYWYFTAIHPSLY